MKKRLETDLIHIATDIILNKDSLDLQQMRLKTMELYEKLTVLEFIENSLFSVGESKVIDSEKKSKNLQTEKKEFFYDRTVKNQSTNNAGSEQKNTDKNTLSTLDEFDKFTKDVFVKIEPEEKNQKEEQIPYTTSKAVSLNEKFSKNLNIGLNDRIAFIKYLFANNPEDYNRVINQIITLSSFEEAKLFMEQMVKPDYNNWEGKDEYVNRFMSIIERKFLDHN